MRIKVVVGIAMSRVAVGLVAIQDILSVRLMRGVSVVNVGVVIFTLGKDVVDGIASAQGCHVCKPI